MDPIVEASGRIGRPCIAEEISHSNVMLLNQSVLYHQFHMEIMPWRHD
jgi:hypothetical protein